MKDQPITDNRPLMNDAELTRLEAEFMERYKGSEKHPVRTLLRFYKGQYHLLIFAAVCYALQGLAAIHYTQKQRGTGKFWRVALIVAAMTLSFMQYVLIVFGVLDQLSDARGLRPPLVPRHNREE